MKERLFHVVMSIAVAIEAKDENTAERKLEDILYEVLRGAPDVKEIYQMHVEWSKEL